jgi:NAD(P)-dependent dehydrogenase (short-subunit alcohol dehydrogenase family)
MIRGSKEDGVGASLAGRVAIVTGGGAGIGRAAALRFAAEGARVLVNDRMRDRVEETVELIRSAGGTATGIAGDVTDSATADDLVTAAVDQHGALDVMFSNAGAGLAQGPLLDISDKGWGKDVQLNLNAMFYCVRAALRVMVPAGRGSIICTSSGSGVRAVPGTGPYGSAKAGLLALVRSAAVEYGDRGVRVNAIVPGTVGTEAFLSWVPAGGDGMERYTQNIPLRRVARPEEVAAAALWLAGDDSSYVTGIALPIDGGAGAGLA